MNALQAAYEKTNLHRMGIPLERSLARLPWLRQVLEGSARRSSPQPQSKPAKRGAR